jgi:DNA-binding NarL/FixJ family response regulator
MWAPVLAPKIQGEVTMQIGVDNNSRVENKRVFIIANDGITGTVLQFMLEDHNETHAFETAEEAYAGAEKTIYGKTEKLVPHLLIVGVGVLQEKGLPILQEIQAHFPNAKIVVAAETNDDPLAKQAIGKGGGAHGALVKPYTVETVRRKVDMMLGRLKAEFVQLDDFSF